MARGEGRLQDTLLRPALRPLRAPHPADLLLLRMPHSVDLPALYSQIPDSDLLRLRTSHPADLSAFYSQTRIYFDWERSSRFLRLDIW
ncbi:hypothetical protein DMENIID0001_144690 [Sergentomyia squamirostris]